MTCSLPSGRRCFARHALFCAVGLAWVIVATEPSARAQANDAQAQAEALFREGREAMRKHEYLRACDKFRQSDAVDPSPGTTLNWALCAEEIGKLAQALEHARWALERLAPDDDRRPIAERVTADLEQRVPRLTLRLSPDTGPLARVYLDDEPIALREGEQTRAVDPGKHVVFVEEPRRPTARFVVTVREGEAVSRTVGAGAAWSSEGREHPVVGGRRGAPAVRSAFVYALAGVGVVGAATTAVMAVLAANEHRVVDLHCPGGLCDAQGFDAANRGRTFVHVGVLSLGLGVTSAAGAAILQWSWSRRDAVSFVPRPDGGAISVVRKF
jgi:hypothetical protein